MLVQVQNNSIEVGSRRIELHSHTSELFMYIRGACGPSQLGFITLTFFLCRKETEMYLKCSIMKICKRYIPRPLTLFVRKSSTVELVMSILG